ncbi:MAG TPA: beta-ketoacyl-[acyl-carrier-protein] synthase family protein [Verrucomicrobiae bacterium]
MADRSPVITGLGIVAATGYGVDVTWNAIRRAKSGLKPLTLFVSSRYGQILAGEAQRDLTALGAPAHGSRSDQLGWLAASEAIGSAEIDFKTCAERAGVVLGCSVGGSFDSERFLTTLMKRRKMRARPTRFHECVSVVDLVADDFGLFGPSMAVATACSSGALAIATAAEMIQASEADVMLVGGADSLSRMTWDGFHSLLLVDAAGCRPFDAGRAGTSMGEGAGVLVLEAEEFAHQRGATILARLSGWGASCDAHHATAPHPEGVGAVAAMQAALRRAGLESSAINYVNAHGTGTRDNDLSESKALKTVFGDRVPPVSSTKRFFGHALAASGAIEAVVCVEALRRQEIPPNPGFTSLDPAIGLEPVTALRSTPLTHVMSNSFGFGGNNAVLIFSHPQMPALTRPSQPSLVAITGIGVVGPGAVSVREIEPPLPPGRVTVHSCGTLADAALLTPNQRRRLSRMVQMALIAARRSHALDSSRRLAVAMGTGLGCLEEGAVFIENVISNDERAPMPSRFSGSVHNAAAAQVAIDLGAHAMNSAPTAGEISFECALWQGLHQLATDEADAALVGAIDELNKYPLSIGKRWGYWTEETRPGEGAVVARLARTEGNPALARVAAVRLGRYRKPFDAVREADWIAAAVDLSKVDVLLSGAKGWPALDPMYAMMAAALSVRAGRTIEHQTYKQLCGEFHSASAFGFSVAVNLVRQQRRGVLLYTLSQRGGKAICCVQP